VRLWSAVVPPDRVHVVLVPPRGTPPEALLGRFAQATGIDSSLLTTTELSANTSLGVVETEALRRLNVALAGSLNEREYTWVVGRSVVPALRANSLSTRARVPDEHHDWFAARSEGVAAFLLNHPGEVVGDVTELSSAPGPDQSVDPGGLPDGTLLQPMEVALTAVSRAHGRYWTKTRRRVDGAAPISLPERLSGGARGASYRAKATLLERADHSRLFGRLARAYLKPDLPDD
jgi:hypothetical protein